MNSKKRYWSINFFDCIIVKSCLIETWLVGALMMIMMPSSWWYRWYLAIRSWIVHCLDLSENSKYLNYIISSINVDVFREKFEGGKSVEVDRSICCKLYFYIKQKYFFLNMFCFSSFFSLSLFIEIFEPMYFAVYSFDNNSDISKHRNEGERKQSGHFHFYWKWLPSDLTVCVYYFLLSFNLANTHIHNEICFKVVCLFICSILCNVFESLLCQQNEHNDIDFHLFCLFFYYYYLFFTIRRFSIKIENKRNER